MVVSCVFIIIRAVKQMRYTKYAVLLAIQPGLHGLMDFVWQGILTTSSLRSDFCFCCGYLYACGEVGSRVF